MSAGVSELQRYSEHCGKAGELRAAFLRVGEEFIATVTPISFPLVQVKLSGSHLTPLCYSFISYVQVSHLEARKNLMEGWPDESVGEGRSTLGKDPS